jgi:hypothetical protein
MRRAGLVLLIAASSAVALPPTDHELIAAALSKSVELQFDGTIDDALRQIAIQTGVPVRLSGEAIDLLPAGTLTPVRGRFANVTLRDGIDLISRRLGLVATFTDEFVELNPLPVLVRGGQAATAEELSLLQVLRDTPLPADERRPSFAALLGSIDATLATLRSLSPRLEDRSRGAVSDDRTLFLPTTSSLYDALESIDEQSSVTWYLWGDGVVIVPKRDLIQRLLLKRVTVSLQDDDVAAVLDDLSRRCGVRFRYDAGAIGSLRPERRTISLATTRATVRGVLDAIQRHTGLTWTVDDEGVLIGQRDRVALLIPLAGGGFAPVTDTQLPADVRIDIERQVAAWLAARSATTRAAQ